jgi:hypothetical protein
MILISCTTKLCPEVNLQIPDYWRYPQYIEMEKGFTSQGPMCLSVVDAQAVLKNMYVCEAYRKDMIDLLDAVRKK